MTIQSLPYQLPTNSGWTFLQITRDALQSSPANLDVAEVDLNPVPAGEMWHVTRITIRCINPISTLQAGAPTINAPAPATFTAYYNNIADNQVADTTSAGAADVAEEIAPIVLNEGDILKLVWSACPQGAVGYANITRSVFRRVVPS